MAILEKLLSENNNIFKYSELPIEGKKSIDIYYKDEQELDINSDDTFKYFEVSIEILKEAIGCPDGLDLNGFEEYHKWYLEEGDTPTHKETYAVILSNDEEVIYDGWHRFHSYVESKVSMIPCVIPHNIDWKSKWEDNCNKLITN
jgi:hypothetical protein